MRDSRAFRKMANFLEELWNSIFTPGTTPTLLVATNASFGALQFLLLILLTATYSIHFLILSLLCAGLWYAINWFARELQIEHAKAAKEQPSSRERSVEPGSDTETEMPPPDTTARTISTSKRGPTQTSHDTPSLGDNLRRRRSLGDQSSSGYVSTDSEWEKVSEGENKQ